MTFAKKFVAAGCAAAMLASPLTATAAPSAAQDESIRRLDIMLMVTSLRCRFGPDNFQPQYGRFSNAHLPTLNAAAKRLEGNYVARFGAKGASRQLDQISVKMANQYGQGHPWLGCGALKKITTELAGTKDPVALANAADELLASGPRSNSRFAIR